MAVRGFSWSGGLDPVEALEHAWRGALEDTRPSVTTRDHPRFVRYGWLGHALSIKPHRRVLLGALCQARELHYFLGSVAIGYEGG